MKNVILYILASFCGLIAQAQDLSGIKVKVTDQEGRPLAGEQISIQSSDYFTPDMEGEFTLPEKKLRIPVRAELRNELFSVLETAYFEEEARLAVKVKRNYHPDDVIQLQLLIVDNKTVDKNFYVNFGGSTFIVPPAGIFSFKDPVRYVSVAIDVPGFEIQETQLNRSTHILTIKLRQQSIDEQMQDPLLLSYEADFHRIIREVEKERYQYERKNSQIQQQILDLQFKLTQEDKFTEEQRKELKRYLREMEKVLRENTEAMRKSEERTKEAIAKIRRIIIEKDSLQVIAQARIVEMEVKQAATEKSYNDKIKIYVFLIVALLIVALVVYFFALKFLRQKEWLREVNIRLKRMQEDLSKSLREINLKNAQIEEHNNQLELFVYKASHDIKGPLQSIMGLTQLGLLDVKETAAQEYFGHIHKSTQRLNNLLVDLLKLTKAKQAEVEKEELKLPLMIEEIINSFKNIRHFERVQFNLDIAEDLVFLSDEKMIYSIVQNFVENGIKYCDLGKEQPYLNISIHQEKEVTIFRFEDNGPGIHAEHLPKIFEMFYKIDPASDGTGLGLHIVKVTIEKLGGTIKVNSKPGRGSVFTITFYE